MKLEERVNKWQKNARVFDNVKPTVGLTSTKNNTWGRPQDNKFEKRSGTQPEENHSSYEGQGECSAPGKDGISSTKCHEIQRRLINSNDGFRDVPTDSKLEGVLYEKKSPNKNNSQLAAVLVSNLDAGQDLSKHGRNTQEECPQCKRWSN
jgi:hypothetical protein